MQTNGLLQRQLSGKNANYGAVEAPPRPPEPHPGWTPPVVATGNPFVGSTNPFREPEPVQPEARDSYMHGSLTDREY